MVPPVSAHVVAKWDPPPLSRDLGKWLQNCFSMGKPISSLRLTAGPLAICCCNKRLRHGQRPRGEVRRRQCPAGDGSIR